MLVRAAPSPVEELGPLAHIVLEYSGMIESRATAKGATLDDWEPLKELVAVETFERVGAYQEVMNWGEYIRFLTEWAGTTRFETTIHRITEVGRTVYEELEERHYRDDGMITKNVMAVFDFDDADRIRHLDIYEQARDTGRWIAEAAQAAVE